MELVKKTAGVVVAGLLIAGFAGGASAKPAKVDVCHVKGDGTYNLINVSENAVPAHEAHGDVVAGTGGLDTDCNEAVVEPVRYTSGELSFSSNGWGGWSCPAGETAVGGGTTASSPVTAEGVAEPGATIGGFTYPTFPHYTFSAGETGYVVQNGATPQSFEVFVDCVPSE